MRTLTLTLLLACSTALAQGEVCSVARPLSGQRLLRRLSLDLRNQVPSLAEQQAQTGKEAIDPATLDQFLASPDFAQVMRGYHQQLLWPNLDQVNLDPLQQKLTPVEIPAINPDGGSYPPQADGGIQTTVVHYSFLRALMVRTVTRAFAPCRDAPATFDANGMPITTPLMEGGVRTAEQEGWVEIAPYWAPTTTIKVCAFDALAADTAPMCAPADTARSPYMKQFCDLFGTYATAAGLTLTSQPNDCRDQYALLSAGCGCGPGLRLCHTEQTAAELRNAMIEQQLKMVDRVALQDVPYTDLLLSKGAELNGPLTHYLSYQSRTSLDVFGEADTTTPLPPGVGFLDKQWVPVTRTGRHSGVLTTPGYLLKFQSNRGRAHRFYNAFECSSFIPGGALPSPTEACSKHEDLTQRCGCDACHKKLEPLAAGWGRFAEYGATPLDDARYPKVQSSSCYPVTSLEQLVRCYRFYQVQVVGDELPYKNMLRPYVFRPPADVSRIEQGPSSVVQQSIDSGALATCTARRMWSYFMRRTPTPEEEVSEIAPMATAFKNGGYRLKPLIKSIVTHPAYGRLP